MFNGGSKAEITNLELHSVGEKEITQFDVTMNNPMAMHVSDGIQQLVHVEAHFCGSQSLPFPQHINKCLVLTNLKHHVNIDIVFKHVMEFDDVRMLQ